MTLPMNDETCEKVRAAVRHARESNEAGPATLTDEWLDKALALLEPEKKKPAWVVRGGHIVVIDPAVQYVESLALAETLAALLRPLFDTLNRIDPTNTANPRRTLEDLKSAGELGIAFLNEHKVENEPSKS